MALRLINKGTKRIELGEDDWLEVRTELSKRQFSTLLQTLPSDFGDTQSMTIGQTEAFTNGIFESFVVDWSVVDDEGNKVPVTLDNYLDLTRESASAIDVALMEHFNAQTPSEQELTKSPKPRRA